MSLRVHSYLTRVPLGTGDGIYCCVPHFITFPLFKRERSSPRRTVWYHPGSSISIEPEEGFHRYYRYSVYCFAAGRGFSGLVFESGILGLESRYSIWVPPVVLLPYQFVVLGPNPGSTGAVNLTSPLVSA